MSHRYHFQRFEFKYQLQLRHVAPLTRELLKFMRYDPYVEDLPEKRYQVVSLYYDSPRFSYYHEKIDGMLNRKKIRKRTYRDAHGTTIAAPEFFEIKRKYDMIIRKDRALEGGQQNKTAPQLTGEFLQEKLSRGLIPTALITYFRTPFIGVFEDRLRITIDSDIRTAAPIAETLHAPEYLPVLTNSAILEVKYNVALPYWFLRIIQRFELSRIAYSKYCNALEKLYPQLKMT